MAAPSISLLAVMAIMSDEGRNVRFQPYEDRRGGEVRLLPRDGRRLDFSRIPGEPYGKRVTKLSVTTLEKALRTGLLRAERLVVDHGDGLPPSMDAYADAILTPAGSALLEEHRWRLQTNENHGYAILRPQGWRRPPVAPGPALKIIRSTETRHYVDPMPYGVTGAEIPHDGRVRGGEERYVSRDDVLKVVFDASEIEEALKQLPVLEDPVKNTYSQEAQEIEALPAVQEIRARWKETRKAMRAGSSASA